MTTVIIKIQAVPGFAQDSETTCLATSRPQ